MSARLWPSHRSCAVCSTDFFPKSTVQLYCSPTCRDRAKYDRVRNDPDRWAAYLANLRANYEPKGKPPGPTPTHVGCSVDDCGSRHLARGFCLKHYRRDRYRRGLDRQTPVEIVSALIKHYNKAGDFTEDASSRRLVARVAGRLLLPECPDCGATMVKVRTDDDLDLRDCGACRVRVLLNSEEVSWLTSEALSTEPSRRIKNS